MSLADVIQKAQFVVDADGEKKAVLLDYSSWEELLNLLEDLEDADEIQSLREPGDEKIITWQQAKAELRSEGIVV